MSDLAKLLGDAYQNLDSFPLDKQKEILDIPVFHDDQHGTAIITPAALINACH